MLNNTKEYVKSLVPKEKFLKCNSWEQRFIAQIMQYEKLTPKQSSLVKEISKKYQVRDNRVRIEELASNLYD